MERFRGSRLREVSLNSTPQSVSLLVELPSEVPPEALWPQLQLRTFDFPLDVTVTPAVYQSGGLSRSRRHSQVRVDTREPGQSRPGHWVVMGFEASRGVARFGKHIGWSTPGKGFRGATDCRQGADVSPSASATS